MLLLLATGCLVVAVADRCDVDAMSTTRVDNLEITGTTDATGNVRARASVQIDEDLTAGDADDDTHALRGTTTVRMTGVDSIPTLAMENDARQWSIRVNGAASANDFVIRNVTGGADLLTIAGSTFLVTTGSGFTANGAVILNAVSGTTSINGSTNVGNGNTDNLTVTGQQGFAGTAPTLASCGASPSAVTGNDNVGYFTTGTGGVTCTLTFSRTMTNKPSCIITSPAGTLPVCAASATALTCSTTIASTEYHYHCFKL